MTLHTADIQALAQRLERVERDLRWWKRFGGTTLTILVAIMLLAATSGKVPDEIRAKRFVLEDANGKERASLTAEADGQARLIVHDENGIGRAALGVLPDGSPVLGLGGKSGKARVSLAVMAPNDTPILSLFDKDAKRRTELGVLPDGSPHLTLRGGDEKVIWQAP